MAWWQWSDKLFGKQPDDVLERRLIAVLDDFHDLGFTLTQPLDWPSFMRYATAEALRSQALFKALGKPHKASQLPLHALVYELLAIGVPHRGQRSLSFISPISPELHLSARHTHDPQGLDALLEQLARLTHRHKPNEQLRPIGLFQRHDFDAGLSLLDFELNGQEHHWRLPIHGCLPAFYTQLDALTQQLGLPGRFVYSVATYTALQQHGATLFERELVMQAPSEPFAHLHILAYYTPARRAAIQERTGLALPWLSELDMEAQ